MKELSSMHAGYKLTRMLDSRYIHLLRMDQPEKSSSVCMEVQKDLSEDKYWELDSKIVTLIPDPISDRDYISCWDYVNNQQIALDSYSFLVSGSMVIDVLLSDNVLSLSAYIEKFRELNPTGVAFLTQPSRECTSIEHITKYLTTEV